jgi:hypothetical protein
MSAYLRLIYDRMEFLEFKQSILYLKQPQHKATIFNELSLESFLEIRDMTKDFSQNIENGQIFNIKDYEAKLFEIWPQIKSYPSSSNLVAKALMKNEIYTSLFSHEN